MKPMQARSCGQLQSTCTCAACRLRASGAPHLKAMAGCGACAAHTHSMDGARRHYLHGRQAICDGLPRSALQSTELATALHRSPGRGSAVISRPSRLIDHASLSSVSTAGQSCRLPACSPALLPPLGAAHPGWRRRQQAHHAPGALSCALLLPAPPFVRSTASKGQGCALPEPPASTAATELASRVSLQTGSACQAVVGLPPASRRPSSRVASPGARSRRHRAPRAPVAVASGTRKLLTSCAVAAAPHCRPPASPPRRRHCLPIPARPQLAARAAEHHGDQGPGR